MKEDAALVIVSTSFPITGNGSEAAGSFVSDLAEEISKEVPVRVVAPGTSNAEERWSSNVQVFRYSAPEKPLSTLKPWVPNQLAQIRKVLQGGKKATERAVSCGPTAHVLALWALPSGHWARDAARKVNVPYSVWTLGSDIWTLGKIPGLRSYLRAVLRHADTCYSDGMKLAEDTRRICGRDVQFLPSTRRTDRHRREPPRIAAPYRLLFLGRWHPNKGVDLLLDALNLLDEKAWERIEIMEICGGGPLESRVKAGVERLQGSGRPVKLRGYLDKSAAEKAIENADYLLIPSRIESIPVVFSDSMKLGTPVVSMPVGDLANLVGRGAGYLAEHVDAISFALAIGCALDRSAGGLADSVREVADEFSLDKIAARIRCSLLQSGPKIF